LTHDKLHRPGRAGSTELRATSDLHLGSSDLRL
jgi:hypothetical protein